MTKKKIHQPSNRSTTTKDLNQQIFTKKKKKHSINNNTASIHKMKTKTNLVVQETLHMHTLYALEHQQQFTTRMIPSVPPAERPMLLTIFTVKVLTEVDLSAVAAPRNPPTTLHIPRQTPPYLDDWGINIHTVVIFLCAWDIQQIEKARQPHPQYIGIADKLLVQNWVSPSFRAEYAGQTPHLRKASFELTRKEQCAYPLLCMMHICTITPPST